jgi:two-component system, chemotaxis family, protein-glutamate methylesterase/glutaminase
MIRVLVVDDSTVARKVLTEALARQPDIQVIGSAVDPYDARDKILRLAPDVITLDIEMPRMDGLSFLARLMKYHPIPVVIVSSLTPRNSEAALRALAIGAIEVIAKPGGSARQAIAGHSVASPDLAAQLAYAVRAAAAAQLDRSPLRLGTAGPAGSTLPAQSTVGSRRRIVAIGASTGGPLAIEKLLATFPATAPATLVVQHMPAGFTAAYARRLDAACVLDVREAVDGDAVVQGSVLVAPGGRHMVLQRRGGALVVGVLDGPPVHHQRPAVDVLFHSVAQLVRDDAVGVLLTGMGADGASGMRALRDAGSHTIAQDEATSVVYSMPREAVRFGGVCEVLPLARIATAAVNAAARGAAGPAPQRAGA